MAAVVRTGADRMAGDMVVGTMAVEEAREPDMADTRLLELRESRA